MSKLKPNFTQIPNVFLDEIMCELEKGELKVLLYVMRRTYGFGKERDSISFSQMRNGVTNKNGKKLDNGTGLKDDSISRSIASLEEKGLLKVNRERMTNTYSLNLKYPTPTIGVLLPQELSTPTIGVKVLLPQELQKKEKESIQKKEIQNFKESQSYLTSVPEDDVMRFSKEYKASPSKIRTKAEELSLWCDRSGKKMKNYQAFLRGALLRDFGKRGDDVLNY